MTSSDDGLDDIFDRIPALPPLPAPVKVHAVEGESPEASPAPGEGVSGDTETGDTGTGVTVPPTVKQPAEAAAGAAPTDWFDQLLEELHRRRPPPGDTGPE